MVARQLCVPLEEPTDGPPDSPQIKLFSNGNFLVDVKKNVRGFTCFVIQTQSPNVSEHILELLCLLRTLRDNGSERIIAVLPYMPYIRSDKKDHPRSTLGAKLFADLLQEAGAQGVLLMDPHFLQINGFFDEGKCKVETLRSKAIFSREIILNYDLTDSVVIAPDINEGKHAGPIASMLKIPIAIIDKRRYDDSEKAVPVAMIGEVKGKHGWMFDDEAMSLGTILVSADFLAEQGLASLRIAVTHPVLTNLANLRKLQEHPLVKEVIFMDTIPIPAEKRIPKLRVLSAMRYFADAIQIIHDGGSLEAYKRKLYDDIDPEL